MLLLKIDRQGRQPVFRQIAQQIIQLIQNDTLRPGDILPPTRDLATTLSVSRFTVSQAYSELWAQGYTEARQGSNTRVRARPKLVTRSDRKRAEALSEIRTSRAAQSLAELRRNSAAIRGNRANTIDFSSLALTPELFPVDELRATFSRVLRPQNAKLMNYSDPAGYPPLRQFIATRMQRHGVEIRPEHVMITHGSQQGLALVVRLLADEGQSVVVEQPTYSSVGPLMQASGVRARGVPMLDEGMDLDALAALLRRSSKSQRPALVYTIPTYHNPTGITTSQPHRERLLELCERYDVPLVEDGFQEEITYFDKVVLPIKSMDRRELMFYLGSFSKVFCPGLRVGWIAARELCIEQLALLKRVEDLSCSPFVQAALHRFCASGAYELHLRHMNRIFAARLRRTITAIRAHLPKSRIRFVEPTGGYLLWLQLEGLHATEAQVLTTLQQHGVTAAPGSLFFLNKRLEVSFRLSISSLGDAEIADGVRRIGKALHSLK